MPNLDASANCRRRKGYCRRLRGLGGVPGMAPGGSIWGRVPIAVVWIQATQLFAGWRPEDWLRMVAAARALGGPSPFFVCLRGPSVESRTGALTIGSGGVSVAFASGLSPAPLSRFQSPLSEPDVQFSRIRLSSGIMRLAHGSPVAFVDDSCGVGTLPDSIHFRSRVAARPVDALTTPSSSDNPFTFAWDASGVSGPFAGVAGFRHSRDPSPFGHRSSPEAPSLHRRYPASPLLRASPPP